MSMKYHDLMLTICNIIDNMKSSNFDAISEYCNCNNSIYTLGHKPSFHETRKQSLTCYPLPVCYLHLNHVTCYTMLYLLLLTSRLLNVHGKVDHLGFLTKVVRPSTINQQPFSTWEQSSSSTTRHVHKDW